MTAAQAFSGLLAVPLTFYIAVGLGSLTLLLDGWRLEQLGLHARIGVFTVIGFIAVTLVLIILGALS